MTTTNDTENGEKKTPPQKRLPTFQLLVSAVLLIVVFVLVIWKGEALRTILTGNLDKSQKQRAKFEPPEEGAWRFIVSGDSRNCGDVVMPAIAADSVPRFQPSFYWHLGDLRAIYKIDEDMAFAELKAGRYLGCENYVKRAWPDFIENQIAPFGNTPFYLGIGNHEVIPPKYKPIGGQDLVPPEVKGAQFTAQFTDWLLTPALEKQQRDDCEKAAKKNTSGKPACVIAARNYYHWIQGGVDFIYLDNAADFFGKAQMDWFMTILGYARDDEKIRTLVVGMHEALPGSISADHAMCDVNKPRDKVWKASCADGEQVYKELLDFQKTYPEKHVYVLASHSHYYMEGIFNSRTEPEHLQGWIVGTAGAVRYPLPEGASKSVGPRTNVYGYLLGTVDKNGKVKFKFQEVKQEDVPHLVSRRYPRTFVDWCFAHNSEDIDPDPVETTTKCLAPRADPTPSPSPKK